MTVTSRVPALLDYLVTLFASAVTLGQAVPPVTVFDGPPTTGLDPALALFVGVPDPDSESAESAADFTQEWAGLGFSRNELITVHCCAQAWAGTDDLRTVRLAVTGIVAAVETLVASDASQFGGNSAFPVPGVTSGELRQNNTDRGAIARVAFDLTFRSLGLR